MSLSAKREYLAKIHGRYQRAGRPHKRRILDEFCANCGYHHKAALRQSHLYRAHEIAANWYYKLPRLLP